MRTILKPTIKAKEVFAECISNVRDQNFKRVLTDSLDQIEKAENDFDKKKQSNQLYLIKRNLVVSSVVNANVLTSIYTDRMVSKKNSARVYYDNILILAPNGKCPLCNQRIANTLDHYLPKSEYPLLTVSPLNLIPACTDCNKGKLIDYPTNSQEETLHPYYDDIEDDNWLKCRLLNIKPIIFEFYISPPINWSHLFQARVNNHFNSFKINELYKSHAAEEYENIKIQIEKLFRQGGANLLKAFLLDCFESRNSINKNSWQTAFYDGILNNINFCNGEFL
jgi:5-methylcytosine-specific restriction endonuclease McrA